MKGGDRKQERKQTKVKRNREDIRRHRERI